MARRNIASVVLAATGTVMIAAHQPAPQRQVAITFDDLPGASAGRTDVEYFHDFTAELVAALARHQVPATGFVNESKLEAGGVLDAARVAVLKQWADAGLELGNHTYSHRDLHTTPLDEFKQDVVRGETTINRLMADAGKRVRFFRHPFLHTGRDAATRHDLEAFLAERGYRVAPVTIDNYDYTFARAYDRVSHGAERQRIVDAYLAYMTSVVEYYEAQSRLLLGRELPQVLLLHANALNGRSFDALAKMMRDRGYRFVSLETAIEDAAYRSRDEFYGPGGITWLHRWALTEGRRGGFFSGEPVVPVWIQQAGK
jgi:peptidoglycan/xylan/chitin deacetylase (PgdA/CDA1 family)